MHVHGHRNNQTNTKLLFKFGSVYIEIHVIVKLVIIKLESEEIKKKLHCGYSLESSRRGDSNEHPQHRFL